MSKFSGKSVNNLDYQHKGKLLLNDINNYYNLNCHSFF